MRKEINPDELMHDLTGAQSEADATPAMIYTYAFTAYVSSFHDGNQAGSQRSAALALSNYTPLHVPKPQVPAQPQTTAGTARKLTPGRYSCANFGGSIQLGGGGSTFQGGLSASGNMTLTGNHYSFDVGASGPPRGPTRWIPLRSAFDSMACWCTRSPACLTVDRWGSLHQVSLRTESKCHRWSSPRGGGLCRVITNPESLPAQRLAACTEARVTAALSFCFAARCS